MTCNYAVFVFQQWHFIYAAGLLASWTEIMPNKKMNCGISLGTQDSRQESLLVRTKKIVRCGTAFTDENDENDDATKAYRINDVTLICS